MAGSDDSDDFGAEVHRLFDAAKAGDEQAGWELMMRLADRIRLVIRRHLNERVRRFEDTDDTWQRTLMAVGKLMHDKLPAGRFADVYEFLVYVEGIAYKKTLMTNRHYLDVKRRGDAAFATLSQAEGQFRTAAHTGPPDEAIAHELIERLDNLPDPVEAIVFLKRRGWSQHSIAAALELDEHVVRGVLERARALANLDEGHLKTGPPEPPPARDFPPLPELPEELLARIADEQPDGALMILHLRRDGRPVPAIKPW